MSQLPESDAFRHRPVMESEVVTALGAVPRGILVDATVGGGGHSAALLEAHAGLHLVGLDRDADALVAAADRLRSWGSRVQLRRARFDSMATEVDSAREAGGAAWADLGVSAVLLDLGVSSPQLDRPERGFSYREAGPLDMRMDPSHGRSAADVVNTYSEGQLARLFRDNGEGRFAGRIARAIVAGRPFSDTVSLAETVREAIPAAARRRGGHPAKRSFQAIRIEVNGELDVLVPALMAGLALLVPGGRLAVLTYHSGEDRLAKATLVAATTGGCTCPPGLPCVCGAVIEYRLVFRGSRTPAAAELAANRRSQSARLRVIERLPSPHSSNAGGTR